MKIQKTITATLLALLSIFYFQVLAFAMPVDGEVFVNSLQKEVSCAATYTRDLTIGSTGSDVVALQNFLEKEGYLTMPAGVAKGYFGSLLQSALASYQSSVGISPANGYFGVITRKVICSGDQPSLPENLSFPTSSRGALKAYALSKIQSGTVIVQSKYNGTFQKVFMQETPQEIIDEIIEEEIEFETIRPEDEVISIYVYLRGFPNNRTLFSGQKNGIRLQKNNLGQWEFPNVGIILVMKESVPVEIPEGVGDVDQVQVRIRDQYGFATKIVNVGYHDGVMFFPAYLAGEFGELVFIDSKGQEFSYDLGSGQYLVAENFEVEYYLGIENYKEEILYGGQFNDFWPVSLENSNGGRTSAPVYRLDVREKTNLKYSGYVYHSDKSGQISVYYPKAGHLVYTDENDKEEVIPVTNWSVEVEIQPGNYMLWIEYEILEVPGYNSSPGKG